MMWSVATLSCFVFQSSPFSLLSLNNFCKHVSVMWGRCAVLFDRLVLLGFSAIDTLFSCRPYNRSGNITCLCN